ncbi:MAG TPA: hypothetical protein VF868_02945 [Bacteroidia bacterium]|jgi:hypothetical protein
MRTNIFLAAITTLVLSSCGSSERQADEQKDSVSSIHSDSKFIIKASNMMYLTINPDSSLVANQPDPTKAEVFQRVDLGNGKVAIKASTGRFLSNNLSKNSTVDVIREKPSGWEEFEVIALDPISVNIRSFDGKYVSADIGSDGKVTANRDAASTWETFSLEPK